MRYYLIAGEASGDLHGAKLMAGLKARDKEAEFRFRGGEKMAAVGGTPFRDYRQTAVMGLTEVAAKAGRILADMKATKADMLAWAPDVLILIDYPGFNLRMAGFAHKHGIKVFYYIAPKLWARGEGRIRKIRKYVDELFVIFPFEIPYFAGLGVKAHYCGNPLMDDIRTVGEAPAEETIVLLPGSRQAELKWMMPRFVEMEKMMAGDARWKGFRLVIAAAPNMTQADYGKYLPESSKIQISREGSGALFSRARAAVICSGTASLEAALADVPQVVCYGFSRFTYAIARMVVKVRYISLANLIADKLIFKELIQNESNAAGMLEELERITFDENCRSGMKQGYAQVRKALGEPGAAQRIAAEMVGILKGKEAVR